MSDDTKGSDRIAKVMARAGIASRRDAERMIVEGRVTVNGTVIKSPALDVTPHDKVTLDGKPIDAPQATRMWLYYKPLGLVTSEKDEKGRQTVFDTMPEGMPRVMSVGRLDITSEGLLLMTNDGALKRRLELPETGWLRKYRVRVNGRPTDQMLAPLRDGVTIEGETFLPMDITIDKQQGANAWLTVGLREGKNREIRRAMTEVGLVVNRLIRISYGPFRLNLMKVGEVVEVKARVLREQLGSMLLTGEAPEERPARERPTRERPSEGRERSGERKSFDRKPREADSERKPHKPREGDGDRKPFDRKPRAASADGERKPYKPRELDGDRKPYKPRPVGVDGDRKPYKPREGDSERKTFTSRPRPAGADTDRKPYKPREGDGERKPYGKPRPMGADADRKPYKPREGDGERKPYGKPRPMGADADRKPYKPREGDGERKPYGKPRPMGADADRKPYKPREGDAERKPYGKPRPAAADADRKPYKPRTTPGSDGDRKPWKPREGDGERKSFGARPRPTGDGERKTFSSKPRPAGDRPTGAPRKPRGPKS